jgi:excisionase family DNA binding protein
LVKAFHRNKKKNVTCNEFSLQVSMRSDMTLSMAELEILLAKEMARELRVSERTLYTMVQGGMPCFQPGKTLLFNRDRVLEWLTQHERHGKRPSKKAAAEAAR